MGLQRATDYKVLQYNVYVNLDILILIFVQLIMLTDLKTKTVNLQSIMIRFKSRLI